MLLDKISKIRDIAINMHQKAYQNILVGNILKEL